MTVPDHIITPWMDIPAFTLKRSTAFNFNGTMGGTRARVQLSGYSGAHEPGGNYVPEGVVQTSTQKLSLGYSGSGDSVSQFRTLSQADVSYNTSSWAKCDGGSSYYAGRVGWSMSSGHYSPGFFGATADVDMSAYSNYKVLNWFDTMGTGSGSIISKIWAEADVLAEQYMKDNNLDGWYVWDSEYEYVFPYSIASSVYPRPCWKPISAKLGCTIETSSGASNGSLGRSPQITVYASNPSASGNPSYSGYPDDLFLHTGWTHCVDPDGAHSSTVIDTFTIPADVDKTLFREWTLPSSALPPSFAGVYYSDFPVAPNNNLSYYDSWWYQWASPASGTYSLVAAAHEAFIGGAGYPHHPLTWGSNGSSWLDSSWHEYATITIDYATVTIQPARVRFELATDYEVQDLDGIKDRDGRQFRRTR